MSLSRSNLLALCVAAVVAVSAQDANRFRGTKPNVIILFADDFGYGDVGHNAPGVVWETAAIDALAYTGATFKDMHTFPLCTPSRGQMLTGRHPIRTGVTTNFSPDSLFGLPDTEFTIAEMLKPAGYDTIQLGKCEAKIASSKRRASTHTH
jgi:arylsulfatase A